MTALHPHAVTAMRAAELRPTIGHWAAKRFCQKRGCPLGLYTTARILLNAKGL